MAEQENPLGEPLASSSKEEAKVDTDEEEVPDRLNQSAVLNDIPKTAVVLVDPNLGMEQERGDSFQYSTNLPFVPENASQYTPILYGFRIRTKTAQKIKKATCKPPPFYILLDHTIAVIWTMFSGNADTLGVSHLQWALYFLKSIKGPEGTHPRDVRLCMDAIQDQLIIAYADLSEVQVMYSDAQYGDFRPPDLTDASQAETSLNLSMISKSKEQKDIDGGDKPVPVEPDEDQNLLEELENIKNIVGIEDIDIADSVSREKAMNLLSDWKREQIDKIENELRMLHTVEDMMKNVDADNFEGFTTEKQFETLFKRGDGPPPAAEE